MRALDCVALTICINYSDYLIECLSNKNHFLRWIIITAKGDTQTIALCHRIGLEYFCDTAEIIGLDGSEFNARHTKNQLYNLVLREKMLQNSWIATLDADTILPAGFGSHVALDQYSKRYLYGLIGRRMAKSYWEYQLLIEQTRWDAMSEWSGGILGFFSLFHLNGPVTEFPVSIDPGPNYHDDMALQHAFKANALRVIPQIALHLGKKEVNWATRTSPLFNSASHSHPHTYEVVEVLLEQFHTARTCVVFGNQNPSLKTRLLRTYNSICVILYWPRGSNTIDINSASCGSKEESRAICYIDFEEGWHHHLDRFASFDFFIGQEIDEHLAELILQGLNIVSSRLKAIFGLYYNREVFPKSTLGICRLCREVHRVAADSSWVCVSGLNTSGAVDKGLKTIFVVCFCPEDYAEVTYLILWKYRAAAARITLCLCDFVSEFHSLVLGELGVDVRFLTTQRSERIPADNEDVTYYWRCVFQVANYFGKADALLIAASYLTCLEDGVLLLESHNGYHDIVVDQSGVACGLKLLCDNALHIPTASMLCNLANCDSRAKHHFLTGNNGHPGGRWRAHVCVPPGSIILIDSDWTFEDKAESNWLSWGLELSQPARIVTWYRNVLVECTSSFVCSKDSASAPWADASPFSCRGIDEESLLIVLPLRGMPALKARLGFDFELSSDKMLVLGSGKLGCFPICLKGLGAIRTLKKLRDENIPGSTIARLEREIKKGALSVHYDESREWVADLSE